MIRKLLLTTVCIALVFNANAAKMVRVWQPVKQSNLLQLFSVENSAQLTNALPQSDLLPSTNLNNDYSLRLVAASPAKLTASYARYNMFYKGILVWGFQIIYHVPVEAKHINPFITGSYLADLDQDIKTITPTITKQKAILIAKAMFADNVAQHTTGWKQQYSHQQLIIYTPHVNPNEQTTQDVQPALAYRLVLSAYRPGDSEYYPDSEQYTYVINALTGAVITSYSSLQTFAENKHLQKRSMITSKNEPHVTHTSVSSPMATQVTGSGPGGNSKAVPDMTNAMWYGAGTPTYTPLNIPNAISFHQGSPGICYAERVSAPAYRVLRVGDTKLPEWYSDNISTEILTNQPNYATPEDACDSDNAYQNNLDQVTIGSDTTFSPVNDVEFGAQMTYNLIKAITLPDVTVAPFANKQVVILTHIYNTDNAFAVPASSDSPQQLHFGNGISPPNGRFIVLTSLDVVAHEIGHLILDNNGAPLTYANQSGGINESFADMTAKVVQSYVSTQSDDAYQFNPAQPDPFWTVGKNIEQSANTALRYMYDPPLDQSSGGKSIQNANNYTPGLDVHYSSGVYNKAFYVLSTSSGWSIQKAYTVFLYADVKYWRNSPDQTFGTACIGAISAAYMLYGATAQAKVLSVLEGVGIKCKLPHQFKETLARDAHQ
tara:strand:- start:91657 stop:93633 length:1977 start_codon:yes stop_codon:yes gene_type:complete